MEWETGRASASGRDAETCTVSGATTGAAEAAGAVDGSEALTGATVEETSCSGTFGVRWNIANKPRFFVAASTGAEIAGTEIAGAETLAATGTVFCIGAAGIGKEPA